MGDSNAQPVTRAALNRDMPSFAVLILIVTSFALTFFSLIIGLILMPRITAITLACIVTLFAGWWYWKSSRPGPDHWRRVAFLELRDGRAILVPDRRMRSIGYKAAEAPFPIGSRLEYHIETGDRYFTGDHAQVLNRTLWAVEPNGTRHQLLESAVYLNLKTAATNLQRLGIPFSVVKTYDGQEGEHTEADVTKDYIRASARAWNRGPIAILIGSSGLWLGALAGALVPNAGCVIAIGFLGYAAIAIVAIRSNLLKPTALIQLLATIPSYGGGYAVAALVSRHIVNR